jgi:hypothetical protein
MAGGLWAREQRPASLLQFAFEAFASELAMTNDPVLIAYTVKELANGKNVWTRIGAAWPHDSGAGLTLILDAKPLDNKIVLIEPSEADLDPG